jgi:predicted nuclease of predicted toxin-antitoxin system
MNFIVDVNLPKRFSYFNSPQFIHAVDINDEMTDKQLWEYAIFNDLVILTKDSDFYNRSVTSRVKPRVIYFQLGNTTLKEMHKYFEKNWLLILNSIQSNYLVIAYPDSIQTII